MTYTTVGRLGVETLMPELIAPKQFKMPAPTPATVAPGRNQWRIPSAPPPSPAPIVTPPAPNPLLLVTAPPPAPAASSNGGASSSSGQLYQVANQPAAPIAPPALTADGTAAPATGLDPTMVLVGVFALAAAFVAFGGGGSRRR